MNIKNFILRTLFTDEQIAVIWRALNYSLHTYIRKDNKPQAAVVADVINETAKILGIKANEFIVQEEVRKIIKSTQDYVAERIRLERVKAFRDGYEYGVDETEKRLQDEPLDSVLKVGAIIDFSKCEKCKNRNTCLVREAIADAENKNGEEPKKTDEETKKPDEETPEEETPTAYV
jgi:hypothetical protein